MSFAHNTRAVPAAAAPTTVQQLLDNAPFSRRHAAILGLAFLALMLEGIELQLWAFIYPQIIRDWGTTLETVTMIVTAGLITLTLGSVVAGPLADRIGRKPVIVSGVALFGAATLAGAIAPDEFWLGAARAAACFGLGAVMPLLVTLVSETMPLKRRTSLVGLVFAGFTIGPVIVGALAGKVIPAFGWHALLAGGGIVALLLLPVLAVAMPESPGYLARMHGRSEQLDRILRQLTATADLSAISFELPRAGRTSNAVHAVLSRTNWLRSMLVWFCYFVVAGIVYIFINYLPLMAATIGVSTAAAGLAVVSLGIAGVLGSLSIGILMTKLGRFAVIAAFLALATLTVWATAVVDLNAMTLIILSALLGLAVVGLNAGMNAFSTTDGIFPPEGRATGVSWMHGFGKAGSIVSGIVGGSMLAAGWGMGQIYFVLGFPLVLAIIAVLTLAVMVRRSALSQISAIPQDAAGVRSADPTAAGAPADGL
ncbi:MFS transporter [Paenarthrobacter sp. NPDC089322]|uniref:MFS transporter n=1 Tax=Paenarthrobacter sp. NPDC089322 TaxID=3155065 RepID=UPI003449F7EE